MFSIYCTYNGLNYHVSASWKHTNVFVCVAEGQEQLNAEVWASVLVPT